MKRKILTAIVAIISATVFTFGLSACGEHKHEYGELKIVKSATCTSEGEGIRICSICGDEISEIIDPLGHDLQTIKGKEPTCIAEGHAEYEACLRPGCGYNTKQTIPETGVHVYGEDNLCIYCQREKTVPKFEIAVDEEGNSYAIFMGVDGWDEPEFVIPSEYNGVPVTVIGSKALKDKPITSITIPDTVKIIETFAFEGTLITEIVIPDSVTEIGDEAFGSCKELTTVILSDNLQKLGGAFNHCEKIKYNKNEEGSGNFLGSKNNPLLVLMNADRDVESFEIDESTKIIFDGAFMGCTKLKEIEIPDTVKSIGSSTFASMLLFNSEYDFEYLNCESLVSVTLPANLGKIPGTMFESCSNLTEIKYFDVKKQEMVVGLPKGLKEIGDGAFAGSGIESIVIPSGVTTIDNSAFEGCAALKEVTFEFGSSCTSIGHNAFASCSQLENIVLPEGLTGIDNYMFMSCGNLEWVYIPAAVQTIGDYVFSDCNNLKYVFYSGTTEAKWNGITLGEFVWGDKDVSTIVYYFSNTNPGDGGRYWWWGGEHGEPVPYQN